MKDIKQIRKKLIKEFKDRVNKQTTFVFCDECGNELISSNSCVSDTDINTTFCCSKCGSWSEWLLDTPVPIRLDKENQNDN